MSECVARVFHGDWLSCLNLLPFKVDIYNIHFKIHSYYSDYVVTVEKNTNSRSQLPQTPQELVHALTSRSVF